jgi:hypothetical protein
VIRALLLAALVACRSASPLAPIVPVETRELVVGVVDDWSATRATLQRWRRADAAAPWRAVTAPWPAVVGNAGVAWGAGLHGVGAPAGRGGPVKREGDGASPAGACALSGADGNTPAKYR